MKTRCASALATVLLLSSFLAATPSSPPNTLEGKRIRALLSAFDAGTPEAIRTFISGHFAASALEDVPLEQRVQRLGNMAREIGPLEFHSMVKESGPEVAFLGRSKKSGEWVEVGMRFEPGSPNGILGLRFEQSEGPGATHAVKKGSDAEVAAAAHAVLNAKAMAGEFSGVALIARDGKPFFHEAVGLADRDFAVPNRPDTKFNLGSINKAFTQVAIAQLAEQGKLSLSDTIRKHLPDYPNPAADKITIQQLVTMTSGLGDIFGEKYDATPKDRLRSLADFLPLFVHEPLLFEPGAGRRYSNAGYIVLGLIIEKVSGESYYDYVRRHVFTPAGMSDTDAWTQDSVVPNRAVGYTRQESRSGAAGKTERVNIYALPARSSSAGGGYSTAMDLLRFDQALRHDKLLSAEYGDWYFSGKSAAPAPVTKPASSRPAKRAGGVGIAGGTSGVNAVLETDLDTGYTVVVLSNLDPPSAESLGRTLRELLGLK
jgi:CubicO group peptidase (beta-lactamase class C family)